MVRREPARLVLLPMSSYCLTKCFLDDAEVSSKSGTPSPMVSRVGGSSTSDLRDMREGSFPRSVRETSLPRSMREGSLPRSVREGSLPRSAREGSVGSNDTVDAEDERMRSTSTMSSLGTRY